MARIAADSKYWLWVNGKPIASEGGLKRGPTPDDSYCDNVELSGFLKKGRNSIAVLLWHFGKSGFSHIDSGQAQLIFDCPALGLSSDSTWLCRIHPAYLTAEPKPNYRLPESNILFDARKDIGNWQTGSTEGFSPAVTVGSTLGKLRPRPIPQWKDSRARNVRFTIRHGDGCDTAEAFLPYNMQMYPTVKMSDPEGGHKVFIQTDNVNGGSEFITPFHCRSNNRRKNGKSAVSTALTLRG